MPRFKTPTALLQPLTATTPLAALFNSWLEPLAHTLALTSPRQRSLARKLLYRLTVHLHHQHFAAERLAEQLEQDPPDLNLSRWVSRQPTRPGIGARVEEAELCIAYASHPQRLKTPQHLQWLNGLSHKYLVKINAEAGPFFGTREKLLAVFAYCSVLGIDLEMLMDSPYPDITPAQVLIKLKALLALTLD